MSYSLDAYEILRRAQRELDDFERLLSANPSPLVAVIHQDLNWNAECKLTRGGYQNGGLDQTVNDFVKEHVGEIIELHRAKLKLGIATSVRTAATAALRALSAAASIENGTLDGSSPQTTEPHASEQR